MERCEECGFDPETFGPDDIPATLRTFPKRFTAPLTRFLPGEDADAVVRARPAPGTWSALEYAGHVRDVFELFDRRVAQIVAADDPVLEVVDHDALVRDGNYNALDPGEVASALGAAAERLASTLESLDAAAWARAGSRDGETRTILDIGRHAVHEGHHHLLDVGRALRAARER